MVGRRVGVVCALLTCALGCGHVRDRADRPDSSLGGGDSAAPYVPEGGAGQRADDGGPGKGGSAGSDAGAKDGAATPEDSPSSDGASAAADSATDGGGDGSTASDADAMPTCAPEPAPADPPPTFVSLRVNAGLPAIPWGGIWDGVREPVYDGDYGARGVRDGTEIELCRPLAGGGRLLSVNPYRGLQLLDVSDPRAPKVRSELPEAGWPARIHGIVAGHAIVSMYSWEARSPTLLAVDVSDPDRLSVGDRYELTTEPGGGGRIEVLHLVRGAGGAAVYALVGDGKAEPQTGLVVGQSRLIGIDVSTGAFVPRRELEIDPGAVLGRGAASSGVLTAQTKRSEDGSFALHVFDVSSPAGDFVPGSPVALPLWGEPSYVGVRNGIVAVPYGIRMQIFDARDMQRIVQVCDSPLPAGVAHVLFLPDRIFVGDTELGAFRIAPDGQCSEYPGASPLWWSPTHSVVAGGTRLAGISGADYGSSSLRLHDVTDPAGPSALLSTLPLPRESSHEGFSVLERALSVSGPGGAPETGLLAIPYPVDSVEPIASGLQLATFGDRTLTLRGTIENSAHTLPLAAGPGSIVLGSDSHLQVLDAANPDAPTVLGTLDLRPTYSRVFTFGSHVARVRTPLSSAWTFPVEGTPEAEVEIVAGGDDPQLGATIASFAVPAVAGLLQVGNLLVSVSASPPANPPGPAELLVFDLSDPTTPKPAGTLTIPGFAWRPPSDEVPLGALPARFGPIYYSRPWPDTLTVPGALVLVSPQTEHVGPLDFTVVDLREPAAPRLAARMTMPCAEQGEGAFTEGASVYYLSSQAGSQNGGPYGPPVAHSFRRIDLADPSTPVVHDPVNVPGYLFAVDGDHFYTVEYPGTGDTSPLDTASLVHRLGIGPAGAAIEATGAAFSGSVRGIGRDDGGRLLVTVTHYLPSGGGPQSSTALVVLDPGNLVELDRTDSIAGRRAVRYLGRNRVVLDGAWTLDVVDTTDPNGLVEESASAGGLVWGGLVWGGPVPGGLPARSIALGEGAVYWASGPYGMGRLPLR